MIQVNLLPREEQISEPRFGLAAPRARFWIPVAVAAGVLLPLGALTAMQRARIDSLQRDIGQTQQEMRALQPQIDRINQLAKEREDLSLRLSIIQGLCRDRYLPVETMDHLADLVPDFLWLTRVGQSAPDQITVEGMAFSNLMIADLMSRMEQSELFNGVQLVVAERSRTEGSPDQPVLSFTLTSKVQP